MQCKICKSEIEPENQTNICFNCQSIIADIEQKVDSF